MNRLKEQVSFGFYKSLWALRSTQYLGQYAIANLLLGRAPSESVKAELPNPKDVVVDLRNLLVLDAQNIAKKLYRVPLEIKPIAHIMTAMRSFLDLFQVWQRERKKDVRIDENLVNGIDYPAYYKQAFHFQADGWLSDKSADLYDYQVETLFGGAAAAMRRQALLPFIDFCSGRDMSKLRVLDLACGTASLAVDLKHNFPNLDLTLVDLSGAYLKKARNRLSNYSRVSFVEANAENLPFKDGSFDVVFCVYLFHELPERVRHFVAQEINRVLVRGGILIFVDSIQLGDKPSFDASLKNFPSHYHEPYFLNYIKQDLSSLFKEGEWSRGSESLAFLSKVLSFQKHSQ